MILNPPLKISARLLPAVQVGDLWISFREDNKVILDCNQVSVLINDYNPGPFHGMPDKFEDILVFMQSALEDPEQDIFSKEAFDMFRDLEVEVDDVLDELRHMDEMEKEFCFTVTLYGRGADAKEAWLQAKGRAYEGDLPHYDTYKKVGK